MQLKQVVLLLAFYCFFTSFAKANVVKATDIGLCESGLQEWALSPDFWQVEYDGGGKVEFLSAQSLSNKSLEKSLKMRPKSARQPSSTHASLLLSKKMPSSLGYELEVTFENTRQLRDSAPNPWEVFWLFFDYKGSARDKTTNYLTVKPNGIELGRAFKEVGQHFLMTDSNVKIQMGQKHKLKLRRLRNQIFISLDGKPVAQFKDKKWPHAMYRNSGSIGLYTEDAEVIVHKFCYRPLNQMASR